MKLEIKNVNNPTRPIISLDGSLQDILMFINENILLIDSPQLWTADINDKFSIRKVTKETGGHVSASDIVVVNRETGEEVSLAQAVIAAPLNISRPSENAQCLMHMVSTLEREFAGIDKDCADIINRYDPNPNDLGQSIPLITKLLRNCLLIKTLQMRLARDVLAETADRGVLAMAAELDGHLSRSLFAYSSVLTDICNSFDTTIAQFTGCDVNDADGCTGEDDDDDDFSECGCECDCHCGCRR